MKLFSRNSRIPMVFLEVRGYFFTKNSRFWEFSLRNFRLGILEFHIIDPRVKSGDDTRLGNSRIP